LGDRRCTQTTRLARHDTHIDTTTNTNTITTPKFLTMSAAVARPVQALRLRRESQRPSLARGPTAKANNMENGVAKEDPKRYVHTQQDILAKFKGSPPSLRVYLHPSHFRINDSQETLSYASPMRELITHIRDKTIPHNMLDEFYSNGIPFYDSEQPRLALHVTNTNVQL
jgi:transcription factor SPT20